MHPAREPNRQSWQRRIMRLADVLRAVGDRLAIEHIDALAAAGAEPAEAVKALGISVSGGVTRWRAVLLIRNRWLELVRADPGLLAPHEAEIATRMAQAEACEPTPTYSMEAK